MKKNKIIILIMLIIIITIAPLLILASIYTGKFSGSTRNVLGMITFAIYAFAMIYSIWFLRSRKNK